MVIDAVNNLDIPNKDAIIKEMEKKLKYHASYITETGEDIEEIRNWKF